MGKPRFLLLLASLICFALVLGLSSATSRGGTALLHSFVDDFDPPGCGPHHHHHHCEKPLPCCSRAEGICSVNCFLPECDPDYGICFNTPPPPSPPPPPPSPPPPPPSPPPPPPSPPPPPPSPPPPPPSPPPPPPSPPPPPPSPPSPPPSPPPPPPSPPPPPVGPLECGLEHDGKRCDGEDHPCCSKEGLCGIEELYCDVAYGCQAAYGQCWSSPRLQAANSLFGGFWAPMELLDVF